MHTQNNYTRKVVVPSSVNIKLEQGTLSVEGPLGTLQIDISLYDPSNLMNIQIKENPVSQIVVQSYYQYAKPIMQTFSTIIESSMIGVTQGHMMQLEAVGVAGKQVVQRVNVALVSRIHKLLDLVVAALALGLIRHGRARV